MLVLEHCGTALDHMCLTDAVASAVLGLLESQIKPALSKIHEKHHIFFDLHPGNVVCNDVNAPTQLHLVDLEALTKVGESLSDSPLKRCKNEERPAKAAVGFDWARFDKLCKWVRNRGATAFGD